MCVAAKSYQTVHRWYVHCTKCKFYVNLKTKSNKQKSPLEYRTHEDLDANLEIERVTSMHEVLGAILRIECVTSMHGSYVQS